MAVDRGYGTGSARSAANSASRRNSAASAGLRKKGIKKAGRKYTSTATAKAKSVSGSSDYVARENAARTQLGTAGVAARARQFPTAARATARGLLREFTGIDVSRKGVSVSPESLAMALPIGKVAKAARALGAAGKTDQAAALMARAAAKIKGQKIGREFSYFDEPVELARESRVRSESVFPRVGGAGTTVRRGRGTVNQKGLEEMIAGGREPSSEMLRIPQILKGTNEAYENIAQKAIKAAGLRKTPKKRGGR